MSAPVPPATSIGVVLSRIFWMLFGPLFLVLLLFLSSERGGGWLTPTDVVYFVVLAGLVVARWIEFRGGDPRTSTGDPATIDQLRKYAIVTILVGVMAWIAVKMLSGIAAPTVDAS